MKRIVCKIEGENLQLYDYESFNFEKIIFYRNLTGWMNKKEVFTVYKHWSFWEPDRISGDENLSYFIITNCDGTGEFGQIDSDAQDYAWQTAALDTEGNRLFPDGLYTIAVTAFDSHENASTAIDTVFVNNG